MKLPEEDIEDTRERGTWLCLGLIGSTKEVGEASNAGDINLQEREREESEDVPDDNRIGGSSKGKYQFSVEQINMLEGIFKTDPNPSSEKRVEIAKKLGLDVRRIDVWFQNRRARTKQRQTLEECQKQVEAMTSKIERLEKELMGYRSPDGNPELQRRVQQPNGEEINILKQQNEQQANMIKELMSQLENMRSMVEAVPWTHLKSTWEDLKAKADIGVPLPTTPRPGPHRGAGASRELINPPDLNHMPTVTGNRDELPEPSPIVPQDLNPRHSADLNPEHPAERPEIQKTGAQGSRRKKRAPESTWNQ